MGECCEVSENDVEEYKYVEVSEYDVEVSENEVEVSENDVEVSENDMCNIGGAWEICESVK